MCLIERKAIHLIDYFSNCVFEYLKALCLIMWWKYTFCKIKYRSQSDTLLSPSQSSNTRIAHRQDWKDFHPFKISENNNMCICFENNQKYFWKEWNANREWVRLQVVQQKQTELLSNCSDIYKYKYTYKIQILIQLVIQIQISKGLQIKREWGCRWFSEDKQSCSCKRLWWVFVSTNTNT